MELHLRYLKVLLEAPRPDKPGVAIVVTYELIILAFILILFHRVT